MQVLLTASLSVALQCASPLVPAEEEAPLYTCLLVHVQLLLLVLLVLLLVVYGGRPRRGCQDVTSYIQCRGRARKRGSRYCFMQGSDTPYSIQHIIM